MNLRLIPLTEEHLPHVMTWVNDKEVMQYFASHQEAISEEDERKYIRWLLESKNDRVFSIFDGDEYVGQCSINAIYWPARTARIFIVVTKKQQGKGYGKAAIRLLIEKGWEVGLHKLWLIVRYDNVESQALYLKMGFRFEGTLLDEYCINGEYYDMVRMGIINPAEANRSCSRKAPN